MKYIASAEEIRLNYHLLLSNNHDNQSSISINQAFCIQLFNMSTSTPDTSPSRKGKSPDYGDNPITPVPTSPSPDNPQLEPTGSSTSEVGELRQLYLTYAKAYESIPDNPSSPDAKPSNTREVLRETTHKTHETRKLNDYFAAMAEDLSAAMATDIADAVARVEQRGQASSTSLKSRSTFDLPSNNSDFGSVDLCHEVEESDEDKAAIRSSAVPEEREIVEVEPEVLHNLLNTILGPADPQFDQHYLPEDEHRLQSEFEFAIRYFRTTAHKDTGLEKMWTTCFQEFDCSPFTILSPRCQFLAGPEQAIVWTARVFSDVFTLIITHHIFEGDPSMVVIALQYAVIQRTNDRRKWTFVDFTTCPALEDLKKTIDAYPGSLPTSVHDIHREIRNEIKQLGELPSAFSDLLVRIGDVVEPDQDGPELPYEHGCIMYKVALEDVVAVASALGYHPPTPLSARPSGGETILGGLKLVDWLERSWMVEQRRWVRKVRSEGRYESDHTPESVPSMLN